MTDDFPQAVMLVSQNATKRVMVVLPMFNVDENNENHGMSPMFIELRSSAEVTSDFFPPLFHSAAVQWFYNQCINKFQVRDLLPRSTSQPKNVIFQRL